MGAIDIWDPRRHRLASIAVWTVKIDPAVFSVVDLKKQTNKNQKRKRLKQIFVGPLWTWPLSSEIMWDVLINIISFVLFHLQYSLGKRVMAVRDVIQKLTYYHWLRDTSVQQCFYIILPCCTWYRFVQRSHWLTLILHSFGFALS